LMMSSQTSVEALSACRKDAGCSVPPADTVSRTFRRTSRSCRTGSYKKLWRSKFTRKVKSQNLRLVWNWHGWPEGGGGRVYFRCFHSLNHIVTCISDL
jgi:hypothetical protein